MNHDEFDAYSVNSSELIQYDVDEIQNFHLYCYEYIDNLNFLIAPEKIIRDEESCEELCRAVKERFLVEGWEGTGKLALLWLPPFTLPFVTDGSTEGMVIWHVKQHEDGVSWLLSPKPLPFNEFTD